MKKRLLITIICIALPTLLFLAIKWSDKGDSAETPADDGIETTASPGPSETPAPEQPETPATDAPDTPATDAPGITGTPAPEPTEAGPVAVHDTDELSEHLAKAISTATQPPVFDISALSDTDTLSMTVRNLYYDLLSMYPEYKYAYDISVTSDDTLLYCTVSYMPYYTGEYPSDFTGIEIDSLTSLIQTAQAGLTEETIPIRITNRTLTVDDMSRALQQVGGSYLLCSLNRDGTAITVTPLNKMTHKEALDRLAEIDALAAQIAADCLNDDMSELEKAEALYTYLTEHVKYDFRYYSEPENMPYESMTAYGALHDDLAICGGYAQALQVLFKQAGIPCVTISGMMGSEYHMWNIANADGTWRFFDATSDRGRAAYDFYYFNADAEQLTRYVWDTDWAERLTED